MFIRDAQILTSSIDKLINKAKLTGKMDASKIFLYNTLVYYKDFIQLTLDNDSIVYKDYKNIINSYINKFVYTNSDILCNYKLSSGASNITTLTNTKPSIAGSAITIPLGAEVDYTFTLITILQNFVTTDGDSYNKVLLYLDGVSGVFTYNNIIVTGQLEIPVSSIINLKYTRANGNIFADSITYRISDNNINSLYSDINTINITGTLVTTNQPASIGDITIYEANRIITVFSLTMFTTQLTPPYSDPEGDLINAIRIDEISSSNSGLLTLNDTAISEGTIITKQEIIDGKFRHNAKDVNSISSDTFNFSVQDAGSLIWVQ